MRHHVRRPTTSWASTICATTWRSTARLLRPARLQLRDRRRGGLDPHRRGAHAADHQRAGQTRRPTCIVHVCAPDHAASSAEDDYTVDEKTKSATLTEEGVEQDREVLGHRQPLRAWQQRAELRTSSTRRSRPTRSGIATANTSSSDGEVIIVDEFTGRMMPGVAGRTASTRRSRQRKASRSSRRTRRSRRSPSRITSVCTRSSRA